MIKEIIILSESHNFWQYVINFDNTDHLQQHRIYPLIVHIYTRFNAKIFWNASLKWTNL